eukprot:541727_1
MDHKHFLSSMSTFAVWLALYSLCIASHAQPEKHASNSSGQYFIMNDTMNMKKECNHSKLCYLFCTYCQDFIFSTNSTAVAIDCNGCDDFKVYAQYAMNFTMRLRNSTYNHFYLHHAQDINITYDSVDYSVIHAPYANRFTFEPVSTDSTYPTSNRYNIFYLDYVSNAIYFDCPNDKSCGLSQSIVAAAHANYFSLKHIQIGSSSIYCPSHDGNVCVIDIDSFDRYVDASIYISKTQHVVSPLNITDVDDYYTTLPDYYYSKNGYYYYTIRFELWCNENDYGVYESSTSIELYVDPVLSHQGGCRDAMFDQWRGRRTGDILQTCCALVDRFSTDPTDRNDTFCDDDGTNCIVDCRDNGTVCSHSNIHPSNSTIDLYVICNQWRQCSRAVIHCPTTVNSSCHISSAAYTDYIMIKSNTNNRYVNLDCQNGECQKIQLWVDPMSRDTNHVINTIVNITCGPVGQCGHLELHTEMADTLQINCLANDACYGLDIDGKSDTQNAIQFYCESKAACNFWHNRLFTTGEYKLDYVAVQFGSSVAPSKVEGLFDVYCSGEKVMNPSMHSDYERYMSTYICDPFRENWNEIRYCNHSQTCHYTFTDTDKIIIYSLDASSLSISCANCTQMNVFANNASRITLHCTRTCDNIKINATYVDTVHFICDTLCRKIMISAAHSQNVTIDSDTLISSEINALHATNVFDLRCSTTCDDLNIAIPSHPSSKTSITCIGDYVCKEMHIYSNNGRWNDINNLSFIMCNRSAYPYTNDPHNWFLYCPSSFPMWEYRPGEYRLRCRYLTAFKPPFCECDRLRNSQITNSVTDAYVTVEFAPFSAECIHFEYRYSNTFQVLKLSQSIFGTIVAIISFSIICVWSILFIKNHLFLRYVHPATYIGPPSLHQFTYISLSDLFVWLIQIYILLLCAGIYGHSKDDICESIPVLDLCKLRSICAIDDGICTSTPLIYSFYIVSFVALCLSMLCVCFGIIMIKLEVCEILCSGNTKCKGRMTHCFTAKLFLYCHSKALQENVIQNEYFQRTFWPIDRPVVLFYLIRYCVFFIGPLLFYFEYIFDDELMDLNIKWYDVFPVLLVLILNEMIKKRYRMLPPYNRTKHVEYILMQFCACTQHIGSLIMSFVGEDDDVECDSICQSPGSLLQQASASSKRIIIFNDGAEETEETGRTYGLDEPDEKQNVDTATGDRVEMVELM